MSADIKKIYITHCSAKKNSVLKSTKAKVTPDKLYIATPTQRFMNKCKNDGVDWAIFSDRYGVWFSNVHHEWYEKSPNRITEDEFNQLVDNFNKSLSQYNEIYFYHNPGRFHRLYKKLLEDSQLKTKIKLFTHLDDISNK